MLVVLYVSFIWTAFRNLRRVNPVNRHFASKLGPVPKIWSMLFKYNASKLIIFVNWKKKIRFPLVTSWCEKNDNHNYQQLTLFSVTVSCFSCGCKFSLLSCCFWIDCNMHRHSFIQSVLIYYNYCPEQLR